MFGSRDAIGKDEGADLLEAKRTPLLLAAFRNSAPQERAVLQRALQDPQHAKGALEHVRQILKRSGAVDHAYELIAQSFAKVYESLHPIEEEFGAIAARVLRAVAAYIEDRQDYKGAVQAYGSNARGS
jgi:geranylgeranyl pyrophosphate synthase